MSKVQLSPPPHLTSPTHPPSSSKPYQVLELLLVSRRGQLRRWTSSSLLLLLPRQLKLRPIGFRTSRQWTPPCSHPHSLLQGGRFSELQPWCFGRDWESRKHVDAFFAVSALWIEGNLSGLPLCDTQRNLAPPPPPHAPSSFLSPLRALSHPPSCSPPPPSLMPSPLTMLPLTCAFVNVTL